MRRPLTALAVALLPTVLIAAPTAAASTWTTDHGNNLRSGYNPQQTLFHALRRAWSRPLDGQVLASPIVVGNSVIVATENDTVYSLTAATGAVQWSQHLHAPAPTSSLACPGNISPSGITGTPAYDAVTNRIFVVTESVSAAFGAHHEIFGLNATNGQVVMNRRVTVPGNAENAEQQRGALAVSGGNVYIPFGGLAGDCGQYRGAVISLKANGQLGATTWQTPTTREGGIWAAGGPVVASDGSVYVAIGNGAATSGAFDGSDSVTRLSPNSQRLDYFAPTTWASDNAGDADLGSMTPALTSLGIILQAGKSGTAYTLRANHLGGIGGQLVAAPLCKAFGVSAVTGSTVYMPCTDGVSRVQVNSAGGFARVWRNSSVVSSPVIGPGALYAVAGSSLVALNPRDGSTMATVSLGAGTTRFTTPALAGNDVFVGTTGGITAVSVN